MLCEFWNYGNRVKYNGDILAEGIKNCGRKLLIYKVGYWQLNLVTLWELNYADDMIIREIRLVDTRKTKSFEINKE